MRFHVPISFTAASKQLRSPCFFQEWLEKKRALLVETQIGYHVSLYFALIGNGATHIRSPLLEFLMFVLSVRALKIGQRCKTLPRKK